MQERVIQDQRYESTAVLNRGVCQNFKSSVKKIVGTKGKIMVMDGDGW